MTEYSRAALNHIYLEAFRALAASYPPGVIVGAGTWSIRINRHNGDVQLCAGYHLRRKSGTWEKKEHCVAL